MRDNEVELKENDVLIGDERVHKSLFREAVNELIGLSSHKNYKWKSYSRVTSRTLGCFMKNHIEFGVLVPFEGDESLESFTFYIGNEKLNKEDRDRLIQDMLSSSDEKILERVLKDNQVKFRIESRKGEIVIKNCLNKSSAHLKKKEFFEKTMDAYKNNSKESIDGIQSHDRDGIEDEERIYQLEFKNHEREEFNDMCSICAAKNNILFNIMLSSFSFSQFSICKECLHEMLSSHFQRYKNEIVLNEI